MDRTHLFVFMSHSDFMSHGDFMYHRDQALRLIPVNAFVCCSDGEISRTISIEIADWGWTYEDGTTLFHGYVSQGSPQCKQLSPILTFQAWHSKHQRGSNI